MKAKRAALDAATYHTKQAKPSVSPRKRKLARFDADRHFWAHVDTSAGPDACHPWTGTVDHGNGYGRLWGVEGLPYAHRVAWQEAHGRKVPKGQHVLHRCIGNKLCTNPDHLYLGKDRENANDRMAQKRHRKKLPPDVVMSIVRMRFAAYPILVKGTNTYTVIAAEFGVGNQCVAAICTGRSQSKVTGISRGSKIAVPLQAGAPIRQAVPTVHEYSSGAVH